MPYIKNYEREVFDVHIEKMAPKISTAGELNYCITTLVHHYTKNMGVCYDIMNDCIGVLEAAKQEYYRKVVAPYEDIKINENGAIEIIPINKE